MPVSASNFASISGLVQFPQLNSCSVPSACAKVPEASTSAVAVRSLLISVAQFFYGQSFLRVKRKNAVKSSDVSARSTDEMALTSGVMTRRNWPII